MSSTEPMSRRRFLAVIAGTTGAAAAAGLGGWRLLGSRGSSLPAAASFAADPGVEIVEVQPGFVDATVWNDELLTLRASPTGTGIMLRSETTDTDHPVDAPEDFTARCVGVIDDALTVGGNQAVEMETLGFEVGIAYESLLANAGQESESLMRQPGRAVTSPHLHTFIDRHPTFVASSDLENWQTDRVEPVTGTGGSIGAILEGEGLAAIEHYAFPEIPDSVFESLLVRLNGTDDAVPDAGLLLPLDHGVIWGTSAVQGRDVLIISDRFGYFGYDMQGTTLFSVTDGSSVLGVQASDDVLYVSVLSSDGVRTRWGFVEGRRVSLQEESLDFPISHQIGATLALVSPSPKELAARSASSDT